MNSLFNPFACDHPLTFAPPPQSPSYYCIAPLHHHLHHPLLRCCDRTLGFRPFEAQPLPHAWPLRLLSELAPLRRRGFFSAPPLKGQGCVTAPPAPLVVWLSAVCAGSPSPPAASLSWKQDSLGFGSPHFPRIQAGPLLTNLIQRGGALSEQEQGLVFHSTDNTRHRRGRTTPKQGLPDRERKIFEITRLDNKKFSENLSAMKFQLAALRYQR